MSRNRCPEGQHHLFPPDTCPALHTKAATPLPPLPFEPEKTIDVPRACKILATNRTTVIRLIRRKLIAAYPIHHSLGAGLKQYRIEYDSLLGFCDTLRRKHHIMSRPPRPEGMRPRDVEVLPFPIADTIDFATVVEHLGVSNNTALKLLDTGELVGYRFFNGPGCEWRIRRSSLVRYLDRIRQEAGKA